MKLKTAMIEGFRGARGPVELKLAGKSLCLLAENGHGKTTIVDALEFWSAGDVQHYHREGYQLDCVVNVDSGAALVRCETTSHPPLTRTLSGGTVSSLHPEGPMAVGATLPPPLPVLRHRTMAEFMDRSPGNKKKVLLELFGLEALGDFRQTLQGQASYTRLPGSEASMAEKWADYLISAVQYNQKGTHIVKVRAHADKGDSVGSATEIARARVVELLEGGSTFSTIVKSKDGKSWNRGAPVQIVTVEGKKYIRTRANAVTADNLGDLPEIVD